MDGRYIHGGELLHLIKAYVTTFHEATAFPEAKTLLAATAEANDRNAKEAALKSYKEEMDHECKSGYKGILSRAPHLFVPSSAADDQRNPRNNIILTPAFRSLQPRQN